MVADAKLMADRLEPLRARGLDLSHQAFEGEEHITVLPADQPQRAPLAATAGPRGAALGPDRPEPRLATRRRRR
jgi:hypothetical protein